MALLEKKASKSIMESGERMSDFEEFMAIYRAEQHQSRKPGLEYLLERTLLDAEHQAESDFEEALKYEKGDKRPMTYSYYKQVSEVLEEKKQIRKEARELEEKAEEMEKEGTFYTDEELVKFYKLFTKALDLHTASIFEYLRDEWIGGDGNQTNISATTAMVCYIIYLISWPERTKESEEEREESRRRDGKAKELRG